MDSVHLPTSSAPKNSRSAREVSGPVGGNLPLNRQMSTAASSVPTFPKSPHQQVAVTEAAFPRRSTNQPNVTVAAAANLVVTKASRPARILPQTSTVGKARHRSSLLKNKNKAAEGEDEFQQDKPVLPKQPLPDDSKTIEYLKVHVKGYLLLS